MIDLKDTFLSHIIRYYNYDMVINIYIIHFMLKITCLQNWKTCIYFHDPTHMQREQVFTLIGCRGVKKAELVCSIYHWVPCRLTVAELEKRARKWVEQVGEKTRKNGNIKERLLELSLFTRFIICYVFKGPYIQLREFQHLQETCFEFHNKVQL